LGRIGKESGKFSSGKGESGLGRGKGKSTRLLYSAGKKGTPTCSYCKGKKKRAKRVLSSRSLRKGERTSFLFGGGKHHREGKERSLKRERIFLPLEWGAKLFRGRAGETQSSVDQKKKRKPRRSSEKKPNGEGRKFLPILQDEKGKKQKVSLFSVLIYEGVHSFFFLKP